VGRRRGGGGEEEELYEEEGEGEDIDDEWIQRTEEEWHGHGEEEYYICMVAARSYIKEHSQPTFSV